MREAGANGVDGNGSTAKAPVYLRLQKRAEQYAPRSRRPFSFWRWMGGAFAILAAAALAWIGYRFLDADPRFRLHSVELRGSRYVARTEVEEVFAPDRDHAVHHIPLQERRNAVEQIPWVRSATVTRILPDQIWVAVQERSPVAFLWTRRGIMLLDAEGMVLETPASSSFALPVVRGVSERESADKRRAKMHRFTALADALGGLGSPLAEEISEVDLSDSKDARLVVTGLFGAVRLHLGAEKFSERYQIFSSQIDHWRRQFGTIDSVDLRYEGQVVIHAGTPVTLHLGKPQSSGSDPQSTPAASPPASL